MYRLGELKHKTVLVFPWCLAGILLPLSCSFAYPYSESQTHHEFSYCFPYKRFLVEQATYLTEQKLNNPSLIWSICYSATAHMATFFFPQGH